MQHQAAVQAAKMLDIMDSDVIYARFVAACTALEAYGSGLSASGLSSDQVASQLHSAVVAVIWKALRIQP
jgi:hypothetical protein